MEQRYVITIQRFNNGTPEARSLTAHTENDALAKFYQELAYAAAADTIASCICEITDYNCKTIKYDMYVKPIAQPEPQPEETFEE